jgi:flagellar biosynthetic protein FliP
MDTLSPLILALFGTIVFSAFTKIFTAISILFLGLGLRNVGFGAIAACLALVLAAVVSLKSPEHKSGLGKLLRGQVVQNADIEVEVRPFLERNTQAEIRARLSRFAPETVEAAAAEKKSEPFELLTAAFLISQLRDALNIGLMFLIPFLVVDLIVANLLLLLGAAQMPLSLVALPVKLFLFLLVDGWTLISERLLGSF